MLVYYLEEAHPEKFTNTGKPLYYNGSLSSSNASSTHFIRNALFYTTAEAAQSDVPLANDWWLPHDYKVKSIPFEELMGHNTQFKFKYIGASYEERRDL